MSTGYLSWSWQIHFTLPPLQLSLQWLHLGTIIPYPSHEPWLCLAVHMLQRERAMPESVVLQGGTSSMLGSFCPCRYHVHSQHYLFQAILCCMHLPYKQQIRQWPACMSSQASTLILIVDVSLRHMQHLWLSSTVPQGWQNPVNFAQSHHHFCSSFRLTIDFARPSIPSTAPFPWDVEKYFHEIVPLTFWVILYLWYMNCDCMMMPSCEILVT